MRGLQLLSYLLLLNSMMFGIFIESWTATYAEVVRQGPHIKQECSEIIKTFDGLVHFMNI